MFAVINTMTQIQNDSLGTVDSMHRTEAAAEALAEPTVLHPLALAEALTHAALTHRAVTLVLHLRGTAHRGNDAGVLRLTEPLAHHVGLAGVEHVGNGVHARAS